MLNKTSSCTECGSIVQKRKHSDRFKWCPVEPRIDATVENVPFYCTECGAIKMPLKALHDYVFIYPIPKPIVPKKTFLILPEPDVVEYSDFGIVLSCGPGHYNTKKFVPTGLLKVGMKVIYDKGVPWEFYWEGTDERPHLIKFMTYLDVKLIPPEDE